MVNKVSSYYKGFHSKDAVLGAVKTDVTLSAKIADKYGKLASPTELHRFLHTMTGLYVDTQSVYNKFWSTFSVSPPSIYSLLSFVSGTAPLYLNLGINVDAPTRIPELGTISL